MIRYFSFTTVILLSAILLWRARTHNSHPLRTPAAAIVEARPTSLQKAIAPPLALGTGGPQPSSQTAPFQTRLATIQSLQKCYSTRDCNFPESDPRAYELALSQELSAQIINYVRDFQADPAAGQALTTLAREGIQNGNEYVQDAALKVFAALPVSEENLKAIVGGLENASDPALMDHAMSEFKRYIGGPWEAQVHDFLSETIAHGAHFTSETMAAQILPFINSASYPIYARSISDMSPKSTAARAVGFALEEYDRLRSGG